MSILTIQVPDSVRKNVERFAQADGVSVDQFFAMAAAEKLAALEAADYIRSRADRADEAAYAGVMEKIPAVKPEEEWDGMGK
jgi:hypothetical protein